MRPTSTLILQQGVPGMRKKMKMAGMPECLRLETPACLCSDTSARVASGCGAFAHWMLSSQALQQPEITRM